MSNMWENIHKRTFIIAEAGKNFIQTEDDRPVAEYLENAKELVREAAAAGADAIKFQIHRVEDEQLDINVTSEHFTGSDRYNWVTRNTKATPTEEFWKPLKAYCDEQGIVFFATPMSREAARVVYEDVGQDLWKIGSGDILDFVMLDYIRNTDTPIVFSSGMSTLEETQKTLAFLKEKNDKLILLHCVSKYPCPANELNLGTIAHYKDLFDTTIGFSDHSIGTIQDLYAVAFGVQVIEKHFSMSRDLWGSDHKVSMTPAELKELVDGVRAVEGNEAKLTELRKEAEEAGAVGTKEKSLQEGEKKFRPLFRKSLMFGRDIAAGETITKDMLYAMRPQAYAVGLPSEEYESIIGKTLTQAVKKYDPVTRDITS